MFPSESEPELADVEMSLGIEEQVKQSRTFSQTVITKHPKVTFAKQNGNNGGESDQTREASFRI